MDRWRKAMRSNPENGCVEVSVAGGTALVRDSKDSAGPRLQITLGAFHELVTSVATDRPQP